MAGPSVLQVLLVLRVLQEPLVLRVQQEPLVLLVLQVLPDRKEIQDHVVMIIYPTT